MKDIEKRIESIYVHQNKIHSLSEVDLKDIVSNVKFNQNV